MRVFDEATLWPRGRFAATVLVARSRYLDAAPSTVARVLAAHEAMVVRCQRGDDATLAAVRGAMADYGARVPPGLLRAAWGRVQFTTDPITESIAEMARVGAALALMPTGSVEGLVACVPPLRHA